MFFLFQQIELTMTVSGSSHGLEKLGPKSIHGPLTKRYFSKGPQNGVLGFRVLTSSYWSFNTEKITQSRKTWFKNQRFYSKNLTFQLSHGGCETKVRSWFPRSFSLKNWNTYKNKLFSKLIMRVLAVSGHFDKIVSALSVFCFKTT